MSKSRIPAADDMVTTLVKPLTKAELEVEARAWIGLLKEQVQRISDAEIRKTPDLISGLYVSISIRDNGGRPKPRGPARSASR